MPNKTERGNPLGLFNIHSIKIEGGFFGDFFPKKRLTMPKKKQKGDPLVSSGFVLRGEKRKNFFLFSSLGQQVQFGVFLKFCRTFGRTILVTSGLSKKIDEKP